MSILDGVLLSVMSSIIVIITLYLVFIEVRGLLEKYSLSKMEKAKKKLTKTEQLIQKVRNKIVEAEIKKILKTHRKLLKIFNNFFEILVSVDNSDQWTPSACCGYFGDTDKEIADKVYINYVINARDMDQKIYLKLTAKDALLCIGNEEEKITDACILYDFHDSTCLAIDHESGHGSAIYRRNSYDLRARWAEKKK